MHISRFCNDITSEEYKIAQLGAYACQNFLIYMSNNIKLFCQETNFKSKKKKKFCFYIIQFDLLQFMLGNIITNKHKLRTIKIVSTCGRNTTPPLSFDQKVTTNKWEEKFVRIWETNYKQSQ